MMEYIEARITDEMEMMEEMDEDIELYDFVESPECANAIILYIHNRKNGDGSEGKDVMDRATKLFDLLKFNTNVLGCIISGDVVCVDGAFYPGDKARARNEN